MTMRLFHRDHEGVAASQNERNRNSSSPTPHESRHRQSRMRAAPCLPLTDIAMHAEFQLCRVSDVWVGLASGGHDYAHWCPTGQWRLTKAGRARFAPSAAPAVNVKSHVK